VREIAQREVIVENIKLPEAPRWHDDTFFFSDIIGRRVYRYEEGGPPSLILAVDQRPSGLGWTPEGDLLVVSQLDQKLLAVRDGSTSVVADCAELCAKTGRQITLNDMGVTDDGIAFIGSFDSEHAELPTLLLRVRPDGSAEVADDTLRHPNGIIITPQRTLLVAEMEGHRITSFEIDSDGDLSARSVFAELESKPDGMCLDVEGAVWVALPEAHVVVRVLEGGTVTDRIDFGDDHPLACTLGGPGRTSLYIAVVEFFDIAGATTPGRYERVSVAAPGAGFP